MDDRNSYVYILANYTNTTLYTGSTGVELKERVWQHKQNIPGSFTSRYNVNTLVYFEVFGDLELALNRGKQIKSGSRANKIKLIESINPTWRDLFDDLG